MIDSLITSVVYAMKDDFLRNIKWHLLFCEFCGLLHFSCTIPKTKLSKLTYIWPMFLLLTYLLIVYHGCIDMINNSFIDVEHNILATTDIFSSAFCIFDHIFTIAFYLVRRKDFTNILLEINAIDINFKRHRLKSLIICALLIIVVSIEELTTLSKYSAYYVLTYSINAYSNIVEQLLIYEVTREIKSKVKYLNDYLLILLKQYEFDGQMEITYANFCIRRNKKYASIEKEIESMREEHRTKFFQHVFKIIITHKKLTHIALNANKLFGIRLLFIALLNLIIPIFTLQYMYHSTHGHGSQGLISYTTWTTVLFCVFVINTNSWVSVANEANKTSTYIHDIWNKFSCKNKIDNTLNHLQLISLQLLNSKLHFTAYGFFTLDWTLLQSMIRGVTIYVIILLQFEMSSQTKMLYMTNSTLDI